MPPTRFLVCGVLLLACAGEALAQARAAPAFQPQRRLFSRLFVGDARDRPRAAPQERVLERKRAANRTCEECEERPGSAHLILDSPRLTPAWLDRHTYQANGGAYGDNVAIADFWYDGVHRRIFSRSLVLHEVDDPADLRLGRAAGTYPNEPDFRATLAPGTTVGHVGFVAWSQNGFGAYFAALQGAVGEPGTGYLDLATVTGKTGVTGTGSRYGPQDLIKHVRLHPSGQLEVGFDTNPDARPATSLLVRGNARVEGRLILAPGGNVPNACALGHGSGRGYSVAISCQPGQLAIAGGGTCASGEMRGSRPVQEGSAPDGWELTCSRSGAHTAYVICCAQ